MTTPDTNTGKLVCEKGHLERVITLLRLHRGEKLASELKDLEEKLSRVPDFRDTLNTPEQYYAHIDIRNKKADLKAKIARVQKEIDSEYFLDEQYVDYEEMDTIIDSSEITPALWLSIAELIIERYSRGYRAIILLHGTDTLGYTSSALSFLLPSHLPVIITGSQKPLYEKSCQRLNTTESTVDERKEFYETLNQEAHDNLVRSCACAYDNSLAGVTVFFYRKLMLGVRVTKISAHNFDHAAFDCPRTMPVVEYRENDGVLHCFDNREELQKMLKLKMPIEEPSIDLTQNIPQVALLPRHRKSADIDKHTSGS